MIFLEGTREGHHQSDEHWNHFKGNVGETCERWSGALSQRIDTILTDLNWKQSNNPACTTNV